MAMRGAGLVVSVATLVACTEPAPHGRREISDRLRDLPGVTVEEWSPPAGFDAPAGYRFFDLLVTVPIDHDDPAAGTFELYAALMHHDVDAPLVVYTSGYDAGWRRFLTEPARIVGGNQVSLEHRFYGRSRCAGRRRSSAAARGPGARRRRPGRRAAATTAPPAVATGRRSGARARPGCRRRCGPAR